ncbi:hypothetical protein [Allomesorhizobium camelthorni]|uniref:Uncharacterized protein n=1 Tax=Allomesorhizobium camelthorni TaxID=475069 RepID=A0A6G4WL18_9HYPH|nr:hypothetical protein [Mesorhizobium camelthorni]NGO55461.1 hypothetical protein [Mesorhizobium camelthorni]
MSAKAGSKPASTASAVVASGRRTGFSSVMPVSLSRGGKAAASRRFRPCGTSPAAVWSAILADLRDQINHYR